MEAIDTLFVVVVVVDESLATVVVTATLLVAALETATVLLLRLVKGEARVRDAHCWARAASMVRA